MNGSRRSARPPAAEEEPLAARRVPTQERSRKRVAQMLDAAAHLFAEEGFDAVTTEAIAARAGVSVGSLYQFYPSKLALYRAVVERHFGEARELFATLLGPGAAERPWESLLDDAIDAFASLDRDRVGFRAILRNWQHAGEVLAGSFALNAEFAGGVEMLLAARAPSLPRARRALVAGVLVEVLASLLFFAAREDATQGARLLAESKLLLRRYLEPYLGASSAPAKPRPRRAKP